MASGIHRPANHRARAFRRRDRADRTHAVEGRDAAAPQAHDIGGPPAEYLIGAVCFVLAIILFLPIPMGNMPPAVAICLFALAILERDGIWAIIGMGAAIAAIAVVWGVLFALFEGGVFMVTRFFD